MKLLPDRSNISLQLVASRRVRRTLSITLTQYDRLIVSMFAGPRSTLSLAYTADKLQSSYLHVARRELWIGQTAFDLTEEDVRKVREALGPHGLRIRSETSQPAADPLGDGKAEEAPASDRARSGAGSLLPHGEGEL